jgi:hypothetical protein
LFNLAAKVVRKAEVKRQRQKKKEEENRQKAEVVKS